MNTLWRSVALAFVAFVVAGFCLPLLGYIFPRNVAERRLGNDINEELNQYLAADRRFGLAQSSWSASARTVMLNVYGVTDESKQQVVSDWVGTIQRERHPDIEFRLDFYEDYRKSPGVNMKSIKKLRTIVIGVRGEQ
jgi:hypothetical protein